MVKIVMVCLGNICRSPLAEGILRAKMEKNGIEGMVDSAGTAPFHVGEKPDHRSVKIAQKYGLDISKLRGRQFTSQDFDDFDFIYVMDASNYQNVMNLARNEKDKSKVELILNVSNPSSNAIVPDPYTGGDEGFEHVYQMLDKACESIVKNLHQHGVR